MRRRDVLKRSAGVLTAATVFSGTSTAREPGELPDDDVPVSRVNPFGKKWDPITVGSGDWITHTIGWLDIEGGDRTKEDVATWLDVVEFSAFIDGEEIQNPEQYWGAIEHAEDRNSWVVWWEYSTPPKQPGLHTFTTQTVYPDGFEDAGFAPGKTTELRSYYQVRGENRR